MRLLACDSRFVQILNRNLYYLRILTGSDLQMQMRVCPTISRSFLFFRFFVVKIILTHVFIV